jgi:hypothetical protein
VQGIKVGLDFLRSRRSQRETIHETIEQEDELFI